MTSQTNGTRALRSVPAGSPASPFPPTLPWEVPDLVGRDELLADAVERLASRRTRMLTLVGTGGVGKTRLAIEVSRRLLPTFAGKVVYVPLSPISDPELVLPAIVRAAGWTEQSTRPPLAVLTERFGADDLLLVLDNFEQVLPAATSLSALLGSCPTVALVVTSRVALRSPGEFVVAVSPLSVPTPTSASERGRGTTLRSIAASDAVTLLVQAARRADASFELTSDNAAAVAEICTRLDGLPLALELAAARLRLLSPQDMVELLGRHLDLLRGTPDPAAPAHHRTLRATIDWSYRMLSDEDRARFASLAVFAGGFDVRSAAAVTGTDVYDLLDTLSRLVDHHLVHTSIGATGERRFHLLDTVRAFALEELASAGTFEAAHRAHADWCVALVEDAAPELTGPQQADALRRLEREHDNVIAALAWLSTASCDPHDERPLRLAASMWRYWWVHGQAADGRARIERTMSLRSWAPTARLADAAFAAGELAEALGDVADARVHVERSLEIRERLGDAVGAASCRNSLGYLARAAGELDRAEALHARALIELRAADATRGVAMSLGGLGAVAYLRGDLATATARWEDTADVVRGLDDRMMLALQLSNLGMARTATGELDGAVTAYDEALALAREFDDVNATLFALTNLGFVLVQLGDLDRAAELLDEALRTVAPLGGVLEPVTHDTYGLLERRRGHTREAAARYVAALDKFADLGAEEHVAGSLEHLGVLAADDGAWEDALAFFVAADRCRAATGTVAVGADAEAGAAALAAAEAALVLDRAPAIRQAARAWTLDDVRARARAFADNAPEALPRGATGGRHPLHPLGLTARETEVARRLVERKTDREIADELLLSVRTVTTHVSAVLRKLGVASRRDVAAVVSAHDVEAARRGR